MAGINTPGAEEDADYGVSSKGLLRESQVIRHETRNVHGAEVVDKGNAWGVVIGLQSYVIDKDAPNVDQVLVKLGLAQEADRAGRYEDSERLRREAARLLNH